MLKGSDTAVVTKAALKFKLGKWRVFDVVFMTKRATLITDGKLRNRYKNLYRVNDYLFIGQEKYQGVSE